MKNIFNELDGLFLQVQPEMFEHEATAISYYNRGVADAEKIVRKFIKKGDLSNTNEADKADSPKSEMS